MTLTEAQRLHLRELEQARSSDLWEEAVTWARGFMGEEGAAYVRKAHAKNPDTWWAGTHYRGGMAFRNKLRAEGFGEEEFGITNLDHIYVAIMQEAAGIIPEEAD